jgi:hypothetical protein
MREKSIVEQLIQKGTKEGKQETVQANPFVQE